MMLGRCAVKTAATIRRIALAALVLGLAVLPAPCGAQALPTATGPGTYIDAGADVSYFQSAWASNTIVGIGVRADANLTWRLGLEGEVRYLQYHQLADISERTYLGGVRYVLKPAGFRPYVKFLAGLGHINLPYGYGYSNNLVLAPGAGVDWQLGESPLTIRLVDVEYQDWTQFYFGSLHPYGVSAGISYRIFSGESRR
jgi:hypothetical protein